MKDYKLKPFSEKSTISYSENLNAQQLAVVENADGPCLVLAGAGSGKTRVLIYRLAYLLEKGIDTRRILLVTFTNKAAHEMINRAEALLKMNLSKMWAGTFHHIGNNILRKEASVLGYAKNFTIIDREDSKDLIEDCIEDLGLTKTGKLFPKKGILATIRSFASNSLKKIEDVVALQYPHMEEFIPHIKKVLARYATKKKGANLMDFDDLLFNWYTLLNDPMLCKKYSEVFDYVLVDEYQDTNRLQFEILKRMSSVHGNILVVGDDAQSIYSFRAADIENLLEFPKVFQGTKIFKLEINYRSSPQILNLANEIIKHNINQFPKELKAIQKDNQLPMAVRTHDVYQQAQFVAQRILELHQEGIALSNIAVLFRSRFQALELEIELLKRNIPYFVRGGVRFFEQAHIKDVLAYLKVIVNPRDELSFKRALSLYRGIGRSFSHKIWEQLMVQKKTKAHIAQHLPKRQQTSFNEFNALMEKISKSQNPEAAIRHIVETYKEYCQVCFDNPNDRILDLEELAKMARSYPTIRNFLLDVNAYEDFKGETILASADTEDILVLSTIHQAKGLEWETVFIIGFSDYEFPHPKALQSPDALEEERRLFYVAVTRTKSLLYISYPQNKYTFKDGLILSRASMFLYELPIVCYEEWNVQGF